MHLLTGTGRDIDDGEEAVDLDLPPTDIVVLSAADSELAALSRAVGRRGPDRPSVALANLMQLSHPLSVDLFVEKTAARAAIVLVRILGGVGYWAYGLEALRAASRAGGPKVAVVSGGDRWDDTLGTYATLDDEDCRRVWRYLAEGGAENTANCLKALDHLIGRGEAPPAPVSLPRAGFYVPGEGVVETCPVAPGSEVVPILFYRSVLHGDSAGPIDALARALAAAGLTPLPIFVTSLKDAGSATFIETSFARNPPAIVLNTTAFAVSGSGVAHDGTVLDRPGRPVLQVVLSGATEAAWRESARGLGPRDLIMNVVLPEVDGRIVTRPVSFKERLDGEGGAGAVYRAEPGRVRFVADQAAAWVRLAATTPNERRVALVLSNYPDRDGRIGNGVGLDTPASTVAIARTMAEAGYDLPGFPEDSAALMTLLLGGRTNESDGVALPLALDDYMAFLADLPPENRTVLAERWGAPEDDPSFVDGAFRLSIHRFGNVVVGIQPARGYGVDPKATYHDPDLVPPHGYLAFYGWLRRAFRADAVVHVGKHGNLEWLPGKALGLSETCWPEAAPGPTPLIYPFIVNDPGEGSQAKRRGSAVIVDHLMPAMTRAEIHGDLAGLENLLDEFFLADGVDRRRRDHLAGEIVASAESLGLDRDLGLVREETEGALQAIDAHLCDLKEMQIRDGLHVLGVSPAGRLRRDTLVAIARVPRSGTAPSAASLHRAIADDFGLGFDPLDCAPEASWTGPRPDELATRGDDVWRTTGDTVERIEALAAALVDVAVEARGQSPSGLTGGSAGDRKPDNEGRRTEAGPRTRAVLDWIADDLAPALDRSGAHEIGGVLAALDGRFVPPGPSGAPTRGRPETIPTGRNFYSVDVRGVPTRAAWEIGRKSAEVLALRYFQDHGVWPRSIAMSAWGTSNMRTGGDDIAHALALAGARPVWEAGTGRVTGFEILPLSELGRPRIDVTFRISGMFRDAFPDQIDLIDSVMRAVAELDEDDGANPIAAAARDSASLLRGAGFDEAAAGRLGATRIFGAKPGAYGAGLQALIDTGSWEKRADLASAFLAWGGFAYGTGRYGDAAEDGLRERLAAADAVFHGQDNREHDILDSDDYYQFQGGLAATVETLSGNAPPVYHGDSSRPEKPVIRGLHEEIARVVRGRAANPKWITGVMRHGYKGAFEIAATVDYLFAFAATTEAVGDHHFDQLFDAYVADDRVRDFLRDTNAPALAEMAARFRDAIDRGLWSPRSNSAYDRLSDLVSEYGRAA